MKHCIILILAIFLCTFSYSQNTNSCVINNAGFESGNTSGWICKYGYYGSGPCPTGSCPRFQTVYTTTGQLNPGGNNAALNSAGDRHVIVSGAGTDPNSGGVVPVVAPGGGNYSFRLGNSVAGGITVGGVTYAQAEAVRLKFLVTSQNAAFTYRYAFFVQNPSHEINAQPSFEVVAMDSADNTLSNCARYYVVAGFPACSNQPNLQTGSGLWLYQNWTDVGMDLTPYIGHNVSIEFRTSDCFPGGGGTQSTTCGNPCTYCNNGLCCTYPVGGTQCTPSSGGNTCNGNSAGAHSAYAYIDAYCSPLGFTPTLFCTGTPSITVCAPAGYTSYSWPAGQPGISGSPSTQCVTINNPVGGVTYTVNMVSPTGCTVHATASLQGVVAQATPPSSICAGQPATLTAIGGGTYSWSTGSTASSIVVIPTASTSYSVSVTNGGCTTAATTTVSVSNMSVALSSLSPAGCTVANGSASATPSGGFAPYTYLWTPGGQTGQNATGLASGTYSVLVTDASGCTSAQTATINITSTSSPSVTATSTQAGCSVSNGTATANPSGGTGAYTYLWTPGSQTGQTATGLSGGTYTVLVTDNNGCTQTTTVNVTITAQPSVTATSTKAGCSVSNGTATANPSGGTGAYTYLWTPGNQNTQTATGLAAGTYTVLLTDNNGCTQTTTVNVAATFPPSVTTSSTKAGCSVSNGTATANPSGGTPGYSYLWSPGGQTASTATGLSGGSYTVVVTDTNGCTATDSIKVLSTSAPTATASATQATCATANGTGTVSPIGGTPGYTFNWAGGQTTQTATGFSPGSYTVLVTDANGCTASASITVTAANGPTVTTAASTTISCNGGSNGIATVSVNGGTPQYTYQWSNGQSTSVATGLSAGTYTVIVTDANNCSFTDMVTLAQPVLIMGSISSLTNASCSGFSDGKATITPTGGTPPYTYSWNTVPAQTTPTATGLKQGSYTVTISDANGCSRDTSLTITEPAVLTASLTATSNVSCNGGKDGNATVNQSGGTPGYTYLWSPGGQTGATATGLTAQTYTVTVQDAHGCTKVLTTSITQPLNPLTATVSVSSGVTCNGLKDGTGVANPAGGTSPYTYLWTSGNQTTKTATGLGAGNYTVTITDSKGCTAVSNLNVSQPATLIAASTTTVNATCNGVKNGSAGVNPTGGTSPYTYLWTPGSQTGQTATGLGAGTYTVVIKDSKGCTTTGSVTVSEPAPLAVAVSGNDSICLGDKTTLTGNASGGTGTFTYVWNPGPLTGSPVIVSPSSSTSYSVVVTDANGCTSVVQTYVVSVLPLPDAHFDTASAGGFYSVHYSFTDSSTGAKQWIWNFGDGTANSTGQNPIHSFPGAGTYTVTEIVFNQFGCPDTFKRVVTIPEGIIIPNVFTPNHDGHNDVWYIPNSGLTEYHVEIFDRWGAKVWEATADEIRWDGRSLSGQLLSDGTYYYVLHAILKSGAKGKDYSTKGYITLLGER